MNNTITPEQWQTHFEQLFWSDLDLDDTNVVVDNLDNADLGDLDQCIFNVLRSRVQKDNQKLK